MKGQRPQRGYLGVGLQPLDEDLAPTLGLAKDSGEIVRTVVPNGPGARGGLVQGDVIVKVNGQQVTPDQTVSYLIANTSVGSRVPLEIIRGGRRATVTVQVGERPTEEALQKISGGGTGVDQGDTSTTAPTPQRALGLSLAPLTPELARAANLPADRSRRNHHRGRSQCQCGRPGPAARRPHHVGQQSGRCEPSPSGRGGRYRP